MRQNVRTSDVLLVPGDSPRTDDALERVLDIATAYDVHPFGVPTWPRA